MSKNNFVVGYYVCKACEVKLGVNGVTSRKLDSFYYCEKCYNSIKEGNNEINQSLMGVKLNEENSTTDNQSSVPSSVDIDTDQHVDGDVCENAVKTDSQD